MPLNENLVTLPKHSVFSAALPNAVLIGSAAESGRVKNSLGIRGYWFRWVGGG